MTRLRNNLNYNDQDNIGDDASQLGTTESHKSSVDSKSNLTSLILLKQQKWRTFSGNKGENLSSFIQQFSEFISNDIPEKIVCLSIIENLRNPAAALVKILTQDNPTEVSAIEHILQENFPDKPSKITIDTFVHQLNKGPESKSKLITFVIELYDLGTKAGISPEGIMKNLNHHLKIQNCKVPLSLQEIISNTVFIFL